MKLYVSSPRKRLVKLINEIQYVQDTIPDIYNETFYVNIKNLCNIS